MKIGIILPTFTEEADLPFETALAAEEAALDGIFTYDHIWPIGYPDRPAVSAAAVLGILTQTTKIIRLGTLVARVGLLPDNLLMAEMKTLNSLSGNRMIAGIGTGDKKSILENTVLHVPEVSVKKRQESLSKVAAALADSGMETWIGAGLDSTNRVAFSVGAKLNFWNLTPEALEKKISFCTKSLSPGDALGAATAGFEDGASVLREDPAIKAEDFTWAGQLPRANRERLSLHGALQSLGISWAVFHLGSNQKKELTDAVSFLAELPKE